MSELRTPPKRLVDLSPSWVGTHEVPNRPVYLAFDCPCGAPDCAWGGRFHVGIANPVDGGPPSPWTPKSYLWQRTGDTFETLTLSPSLHMQGHWHGWLRNGVLESC